MNIIATDTSYGPEVDPMERDEESTATSPEDERSTEDEDDLREIRASDDLDEPDPEDGTLLPLESGDPHVPEEQDDEV